MLPCVCLQSSWFLLSAARVDSPSFNGMWIYGGVLVTVAGLIAWRVYRRYRRLAAFQRMRCSVLMLRQGMLCVRTLGEVPVSRLGCRRQTVRQLVRAAASTPAEQGQPVLDTDDAREVRAALAGYISSLTPVGHLQQALGLSTVTGDFVAGLISDTDKPPHQRRLRLLVVPQPLLENLPVDPPQYEQAADVEFWRWMKCLSRAWRENPVALARVQLAFSGADL